MRFGFVVNFFGKFSGFKRRKTVKATLSPPTEIRNRTTFNNFVLPLDEPRKFIQMRTVWYAASRHIFFVEAVDGVHSYVTIYCQTFSFFPPPPPRNYFFSFSLFVSLSFFLYSMEIFPECNSSPPPSAIPTYSLIRSKFSNCASHLKIQAFNFYNFFFLLVYQISV